MIDHSSFALSRIQSFSNWHGGQIKMQNSVSTLFIAAALALLMPINALDLEGAKESQCFEIKKTVSIDMSWVTAQKTWYYPMMSRLDFYMAGVEMSGKKDLTEDELYYDSCITFGVEGEKFVGYGFNGRKKEYSVKPVKGMEVYEAFNEDGSKFGICYTTLTDNKTYIFTACCTESDQMTWGVSTTMKTPPKETVKLLHKHAESLGFKKEFFTGFRYDHCKLDDDNESKTEL